MAPAPARSPRRWMFWAGLAMVSVSALWLALPYAFGTRGTVTVPTAAGVTWTAWPGDGATRDDARRAGELLAQTFLIQAGGESLARLTLTDGGCVLSMYLDPGEIDTPGAQARAVILRTKLGELF